MPARSWPRRLVSVGAALLALHLCFEGLEPSVALLGHPRSCARAQLLDGQLLCDEELLRSSSELCARGPSRALRSGDALSSEQICAGERGPARMSPEQLEALAQPVDVNTASVGELASLPGIGPKIAARIVEGRPYMSAQDLLEVRGIGPKRLARLRARVELPSARPDQ